MNTDLTSQDTLETYSSSLTTGGKDEFLPKLKAAINSAVKIDMTVAFVRDTGMKLLMPALKEALERGAHVRILTCDYMQITDPAALRSLLLLKEPFNDQGSCAEVRVFESKGISFHMKAYIFIQDNKANSSAFIGSSNITKAALTTGLEWNLRVDQSENVSRFEEICHQFEELFKHKQSIELEHSWVERYQVIYDNSKQRMASVIPGADEQEQPANPNDIQVESYEVVAFPMAKPEPIEAIKFRMDQMGLKAK